MAQLTSTLAANEARANFYQMLEEVGKHLRRFVITHRGRTRAVLISADELESWEETLEILSDKKLMKDLRDAEKDRKAGRVFSLEQVEKELKLNEG